MNNPNTYDLPKLHPLMQADIGLLATNAEYRYLSNTADEMWDNIVKIYPEALLLQSIIDTMELMKYNELAH